MKNIKLLKGIYWTLFISTILMLLYSLRYSPEYKWHTTSAALLLWAITFLVNKRIKKLKDGTEEED